MIKKYFKRIKNKLLTLQTLKLVTEIIFVALSELLYFLPITNMIKTLIFGGLFIMFMVIFSIINEVEKEKQSLPRMTKRFTRLSDDGAVVIDENKYREAILYLYELEDRIYQ